MQRRPTWVLNPQGRVGGMCPPNTHLDILPARSGARSSGNVHYAHEYFRVKTCARRTLRLPGALAPCPPRHRSLPPLAPSEGTRVNDCRAALGVSRMRHLLPISDALGMFVAK